MKLTKKIKEHLKLNVNQNEYRHIPKEFKKVDGKWSFYVNFDEIKDYQLTNVLRNISTLCR